MKLNIYKGASNVKWCRESQGRAAQPSKDISTRNWPPPPSVASSYNSSHPSTTPGSISKRHEPSYKLSNISPSETATIIASLRGKSTDELQKLLSDKEAYSQFLLSLDLVKTQNSLGDELRNETVHLAKKNLEKEPRIQELRNQCSIIRTTELAAARDKMGELERKKREIIELCSPPFILQRMEENMNGTEEECEMLHSRLLRGEVDVSAFIPAYKRLRHTYHMMALTRLSAKISPV